MKNMTFKDTTFLEYTHGQSLIYRFNPLLKLISLLVICIFLGINNTYLTIAVFLIIFFFAINSDNHQKKQIIKMWKL